MSLSDRLDCQPTQCEFAAAIYSPGCHMRTHHFSIQEVPLIASAEILDRVRALRTDIDCHNYAHHVLDAPTIPDADLKIGLTVKCFYGENNGHA